MSWNQQCFCQRKMSCCMWMKQLTGIMTRPGRSYWPPVTYFFIFAVGENIQYQHGSSFGISILLGNTSHFIPIQWHSKLSILDTEQQIHFSILPPYRSRIGDDPLPRSVQGNQIEIHTLVEKPKLSMFQTVQYLFGQKIWPFLHFNL